MKPSSHLPKIRTFGRKSSLAPEIWGVEKLGDSSVEIRIAVKVLPGEHWQIARHLRLLLKINSTQRE